MLRSFKGALTQDIFDGADSKASRRLPVELHDKARRLLDQLDTMCSLMELRSPPSNHLEKLRGYLKGYYSVRINDQWRIIFKWHQGDAEMVEIVDYH